MAKNRERQRENRRKKQYGDDYAKKNGSGVRDMTAYRAIANAGADSKKGK